MPSKSSKPLLIPTSLWKHVPNCTEAQFSKIALEMCSEILSCDRILLSGPMGVGKSTFARALLSCLKVEPTPQGSPTFSIVNEYDSPRGSIIHMDLYRITSPEEIEERGLPFYFWEKKAIILTEWLELFPELRTEILKQYSFGKWLIELSFISAPLVRDLKISRI